MGCSCEELCWETTVKVGGPALKISEGTMRIGPPQTPEGIKQEAEADGILGDYLAEAAHIAFRAGLNVSNKTTEIRSAGNRAVQIILPRNLNGDPDLTGDLVGHVESIVDTVKHCHWLAKEKSLTESSSSTAAADAFKITALVAALAAAYPADRHFHVLDPLWFGMVENNGKVLASFLFLFSSIINLTRPIYARYYSDLVLGKLFRLVLRQRQPGPGSGSAVPTILTAVRGCFDILGPEMEWIVPAFMGSFWAKEGASLLLQSSTHHKQQLVDLTVLIAKRIGLSALLDIITRKVHGVPQSYLLMMMKLVQKAVDDAAAAVDGSTDADACFEELLLEMDHLILWVLKLMMLSGREYIE